MPRPGANPPEFTSAHFPRAAWPEHLTPALSAGRDASQAWAAARDSGKWDGIDTPTFTLAVLDKVLEIEDSARADESAQPASQAPSSEAVIQFVYNKAVAALPRSHRYTQAPAFEKVHAAVVAALDGGAEGSSKLKIDASARRSASATSADASSSPIGSDE